MLILLSLLVFCKCAISAPWNPSTDPLPPLQPKEMGAALLNVQNYYVVSNLQPYLSLNVAGFTFMSLSKQFQQSISSGQNLGSPLMQIASANYTVPQSNSASLLADYNTQTCLSGPIEGDSPYPGYNYYQNEINFLYSAGIPVDYSTFVKDGVTYWQYSSPVPWNNPLLPRAINYTVIFDSSTGYLVEYSLAGTEYCCLGVVGYCPNSGLCPDGSSPVLIYASTIQYWSDYQIFNSTSWEPGFFGDYCPFSTSTSSSSSSQKGLGLPTVLAIFFGILLFLSTLINMSTYIGCFKMVSSSSSSPQPLSSQTDRSGNTIELKSV